MEKISLIHGNGGKHTNELIKNLFLRNFGNNILNDMEDAANLTLQSNKIAFTTDSFVVKPLFFKGGNIGKLAVCGTVNDLAVSGAKPKFITTAFIIEEGFLFKDLEQIVKSMAMEAKKANVMIVGGDTKVVEKGAVDGLFINTTGIGIQRDSISIKAENALVGDLIIVNGTIGDHGAAILCERNSLGINGQLASDCSSLNGLVDTIINVCPKVNVMRDATRGGVAAVLNEIAQSSKVDILLKEEALPISEGVKGVCELFGLDPLYIANEGKLCVFVPEEFGVEVLNEMQKHPLGKNAAIIGRVSEKGTGRVLLETIIGGKRIIDMSSEIQIPRIC